MPEQQTRSIEEMVKPSDPGYYLGGKPLMVADLLHLFLKPRRFFTDHIALGRTPYLLAVVLTVGSASIIGRIDQELMKIELGTSRPGLLALFPALADSWSAFWLTVVLAGGLSGLFTWLAGGWWYRLRLHWSGSFDPAPLQARIVYMYASFIWALPAVLLAVAQTFLHGSYQEAYDSEAMYPALLMLFPFWSVGVSYKAVRAVFPVSAGKARFWFLALPLVFYLLAFGILTYAFSMLGG